MRYVTRLDPTPSGLMQMYRNRRGLRNPYISKTVLVAVVLWGRTPENWVRPRIQNPDGFGDFRRQRRIFFHEKPDGLTENMLQGRSRSPDMGALLERWPDPGSRHDNFAEHEN